MAKKKEISPEWGVITYPEDKIVAAVHLSDMNHADKRIKILPGKYITHEEALKSASAYAKKNKFIHQQ